MQKDREVRRKFREIHGEWGYTAGDVMRMLYKLGIFDCDVRTIRSYAIENDLAVNLSEMGIESSRGIPQFLIPKSKLHALAERLNYDIPMETLEKEISKLE